MMFSSINYRLNLSPWKLFHGEVVGSDETKESSSSSKLLNYFELERNVSHVFTKKISTWREGDGVGTKMTTNAVFSHTTRVFDKFSRVVKRPSASQHTRGPLMRLKPALTHLMMLMASLSLKGAMASVGVPLYIAGPGPT